MKPKYISGFPTREIYIDHHRFLYFGGTSYLGIQTLPEFQELLIDEIRLYGTNYGASRNSNIRLQIYDKSEKYLSSWVGSEACIVLSSGFMAGQLLARYFSPLDYKLFYTTPVHASLFSYDHVVFTDHAQLNTELQHHLDSEDSRSPVVFLDTIDFSPNTFPEFKELKKLPLKSCILIADDSHGIGILGSDGSGAYQYLQDLSPKELLVCSSLGKSMGVPAGAVFGTAARLDALRETSLYAGASPPAPAYMGALLKAAPLYASQRAILNELIEKFHHSLKYPEKFRFLQGYPVYESSDEDLAAYLRREGICITDFDYTAETESWQCRLVITAGHKPEDITLLAEKINRYYR